MSSTSPHSPLLPHPLPPPSFLEWMYPSGGGDENVESAALGILILWTTWFAFNAGSAESISGRHGCIHMIVYTYLMLLYQTLSRVTLCCTSAALPSLILLPLSPSSSPSLSPSLPPSRPSLLSLTPFLPSSLPFSRPSVRPSVPLSVRPSLPPSLLPSLLPSLPLPFLRQGYPCSCGSYCSDNVSGMCLSWNYSDHCLWIGTDLQEG